MKSLDLLMIILRTGLLYLFLLFLIRLLGKRTLGNFTPFDLLIALGLGDLIGEVVYGNQPFIHGIVAILAFAVFKYGINWLSYKSETCRELLEGKATKIIEHGEIQEDGKRRELLSSEEIAAVLRLNGVKDLKEIQNAFMEIDGEISILKEEAVEPIKRRDLLNFNSKYLP